MSPALSRIPDADLRYVLNQLWDEAHDYWLNGEGSRWTSVEKALSRALAAPAPPKNAFGGFVSGAFWWSRAGAD